MAMTLSPANLGQQRAVMGAADRSRVAVIDAFTSFALLPLTVLLAVTGSIVSVMLTGGNLDVTAATPVGLTALGAVVVWVFSSIAPMFSVVFALESIRHGGTRVSQSIALGSLVIALGMLALFTFTQLIP